jgi:hypothetical protein
VKKFILNLSYTLSLSESGSKATIATLENALTTTMYNNFNETSSFNMEQFKEILKGINYSVNDESRETYLASAIKFLAKNANWSENDE